MARTKRMKQDHHQREYKCYQTRKEIPEDIDLLFLFITSDIFWILLPFPPVNHMYYHGKLWIREIMFIFKELE